MADEPAASQKQFALQRLYVKDLSFESPKVPAIFTSDLDAENLLNIRSVNRDLGAERVEVTLQVNVKSVIRDDTIFLIELEQAGIFVISGYTPQERFRLLGTLCPSMLYPYAREVITDMANKGGFPEVFLQPLDFHAMFAQNMGERASPGT